MANRDFYGNWKAAGNKVSDASGFGSFLKSLSPVFGSIGTAINPILGAGLTIGGNILGNYFQNRVVNSSLTGKEVQQNEFNAQQAQLNRDFQAEMSNTAYQRGVADMQAAGLNPALMYGNGSAASTPTGANAQGTASLASPMDIITTAMQMKMINTEIGLKKSQERLNDAKASESVVNAAQIVEMTENIKEQRRQIVAQVEGMHLDNDTKRIVLAYADETERYRLENLKKDVSVKEAEVKQFNAAVEKMSEEKKKIVQEVINLQEQVRLMMSQENLNYSQAEQCGAMIREIDEKVAILQKDNTHYDFNHMKTLSFKDGVAIVSNDAGQYAGSFTGASAAIRPRVKKSK